MGVKRVSQCAQKAESARHCALYIHAIRGAEKKVYQNVKLHAFLRLNMKYES